MHLCGKQTSVKEEVQREEEGKRVAETKVSIVLISSVFCLSFKW